MNETKHTSRHPSELVLPLREPPSSATGFYRSADPASSDPDTVSNAWHSIRRGKFVVLACAAAGLLLAIAASGLQNPMYRGQTLLEVRDPGRAVSPFVPASGASDSGADTTIATEVTLLHSEPLIRSVVGRLKLAERPGFAPTSDLTQSLWHTLRHQSLPPQTPEERAMRTVEQNLSIRHQARIIEVDYNSSDPALAAGVANALAQEHLTQASISDADAAKQLRGWLDKQSAGLNDKLARSESEMQHYAENSGIVQTDSHDTVTQQQLRLLSEELERAEADRMIKQSRLTVASPATGSADSTMPQVVDDPVLRDYQTKLTDLRRQSQELQSLLTPQNYKVQQVESQITVLEAAVAKELGDVRRRSENEYRAALERENMLKARLSDESQHVTAQEAKFIHYGTMQQELDTTRAMHAELLEKAQQLGLTSAAPDTDLRIVSLASVPTRPYTPNYPLNLSLGLFAGVLAGLGAAIGREQVRPRLRAPGDSSMLLQLPELAAVPCIARGRGAGYLLGASGSTNPDGRLELAALNGNPPLLIESIHDALASIMAGCERGFRVILFTSPSPGDGKTTITANLAISLAMCRRKVLLIDGDLRRPRLHQIFNVPSEPGLAEALRDSAGHDSPKAETIHSLSIPNLFLMASGRLVASHAPLLGGQGLGQILSRMRAQYDVILIDAPPVLHGPDARLLGRFADAAILITRARKTTHQDAIAAAGRLSADKIPLAGTILNDWNPRSDAAAYTSYLPSEPEALVQ